MSHALEEKKGHANERSNSDSGMVEGNACEEELQLKYLF